MVKIMNDKPDAAGTFPVGLNIAIVPPQLPLDFTLSTLDCPIVWSIIAGTVEGQDMIVREQSIDCTMVEIAPVVTLEKQRTTKLLEQLLQMIPYFQTTRLSRRYQRSELITTRSRNS